MFLFCVLYSKNKRQNARTKNHVRIKYKERTKKKILVESRFSATVHTGFGARPVSYTMDIGSLPEVQWPGCDINHPPLPSFEIK